MLQYLAGGAFLAAATLTGLVAYKTRKSKGWLIASPIIGAAVAVAEIIGNDVAGLGATTVLAFGLAVRAIVVWKQSKS